MEGSCVDFLVSVGSAQTKVSSGLLLVEGASGTWCCWTVLNWGFLLQDEELDDHNAQVIAHNKSLQLQNEALDDQLERLQLADEALTSQQATMMDQLLHLSALQDTLIREQGSLKEQTQALVEREACLEQDRIALETQAERLISAVAVRAADLDAKAKQWAAAAGSPSPPPQLRRSKERSQADAQAAAALLALEDRQRQLDQQKQDLQQRHRALAEDLSSKQVGLNKQADAQAAAALLALEDRQRQLDQQKQDLQQRHRALAEDLSSRQVGLNEQWAALDIDQSRSEAKAQYLEIQSLELQHEWQAIEDEWAALEAQKSEFRPSWDSVVSTNSSQQGLQDEPSLQSSPEGSNTFSASLDEQMAQLAAEWDAVSGEKEQIAQQWAALKVKEAAMGSSGTGNPSSLGSPACVSPEPLEEGPALAPITTRGDSPREQKGQKIWTNPQVKVRFIFNF